MRIYTQGVPVEASDVIISQTILFIQKNVSSGTYFVSREISFDNHRFSLGGHTSSRFYSDPYFF